MTVSRDRPWMSALEMQFGTLAIVRKLARMPGTPRSVTDAHVLRDLHKSATFGWSADVASAVWQASKSIPDDAVFSRDLLPDGLLSAWWWLDWPLPLPMKYAKKAAGDFRYLDDEHVCAILLSADSDGSWNVSCGRMCAQLGVPMMIEANQFARGVSLHQLSQPETVHVDASRLQVGRIRPRDLALARFVLAACVWLKQRIAVASNERIERHRRKQLAREFHATISDVKVIQLRRAETQSPDDGTGEAVEWSCRWIVSGHWRNQFHPSTGSHELKYILPYVKGPDDKPLKVPSHTVYAVNR